MSTDPSISRVQAWLDAFSAGLSGGDPKSVGRLFLADGFWRDMVAFTWTIVTSQGRDAIEATAAEASRQAASTVFRVDGPVQDQDGTLSAFITFETATGRGVGHLRLKDGLAWTLLTVLRELKGHEERRGPTRERGTDHGIVRGRRTWPDRRRTELEELGRSRQPYCLIVGGSQGGLALGARLRRLGVPTLIIDKHARAGDAWRARYESLCLHDPVWFDHMPYLPFPDHWPVFTPKDRMGDWLESYATLMELVCWQSTTCRGAAYDAATGTWTVTVERDGEMIELRPRQLVLATGMSGLPSVPTIPGASEFAGEQHHSSAHPGGTAYAGKRCVVIGSNNSAHDICADLWEHGADVTMVQRSPTLVVRSDSFMKIVSRLYSEDALAAGITTDRADLLNASWPHRLVPALQRELYAGIRHADAEFYRGLQAAGFMLTFGEDDAGLAVMYMRRGSGYYIDVGASELIIRGDIRLKSGVEVSHMTRDAVVLDDGTALPADVVVFATGYGSMNGWAAELISPQVAELVGPCWGLGSGTTKDPGPWEGELRNMWKPTRQEGLWFQGGNLAQSRFYSALLALQIKARFEGIVSSGRAV